MVVQNDYLVHKAQLMRQFSSVVQRVRPVFVRYYGEALTDSLIAESTQHFADILPTMPDVGGKSNPLTENLLGAAWFLALYKSLKPRGRPLDEIADLMKECYRAYLGQYPRWVMRAMGWAYMHGLYRWRMTRLAARSQKREYPDDWVLTYVPGDGVTFEVGFDFTQCAICKLYRDHDAVDFLPYLCQLDYIECELLGMDLDRQYTLAAGDLVCDFRIKRHRASAP